ncbi:polyphenol oxidase family protein [Actinotalea fermentans]|uniref:Laccase domain protein n=1 Tax=Actinotalea fermentans TaxID=43671 RepID=A0A511YVK4_9CELL|nr:polyphenol oxidase family protein [Actinotalea fermentans]GEN79232.1 laccase domain protein [Actinotalea fermentans]
MTDAVGPDPVVAGLAVVDLGPGVRAAFSGPGNLSRTVGDQDGVLARRQALAAWAGAPVAYAWQVHGRRVHVVTGPAQVPDDGPVAQADALVAIGGRVALAVLVADCVPVLLADGTAGVVGVAHAGRAGVAADVVGATIAAMTAVGADPARLRAVVGPAVCGRCYEVPAALRDEVAQVVPVAASTTTWGTPALDLPAAVASQLARAGVQTVHRVQACTLEDARWFSHRGTGTDATRTPGRFAGVVRALAG